MLLLEGPEDTYELTLEELLEEALLELPTGVYNVEIDGVAPDGYGLETWLSEDHFDLTSEGAELTLYVTITILPLSDTPTTIE